MKPSLLLSLLACLVLLDVATACKPKSASAGERADAQSSDSEPPMASAEGPFSGATAGSVITSEASPSVRRPIRSPSSPLTPERFIVENLMGHIWQLVGKDACMKRSGTDSFSRLALTFVSTDRLILTMIPYEDGSCSGEAAEAEKMEASYALEAATRGEGYNFTFTVTGQGSTFSILKMASDKVFWGLSQDGLTGTSEESRTVLYDELSWFVSPR